MTVTPEDKICALGIWNGPIEIVPLLGGITNRNYLITDSCKRFVVRLGTDIPVHHISRASELAASKAAHAAGLSPAVIHHEPGVLVLDFIEGRQLAPEDICRPSMLPDIVSLVRRCHQNVAKHFRGPTTMFWVFHVLRDYAAALTAADSAHKARLDDFMTIAADLERQAGPFDIAFCHNDLLANNLLDDGRRLWLIDWDYAGFNTPLFDLGGLASNNGLSEPQEIDLLEAYFEMPVDDGLWRRYQAMKCASLLRETMWSMVSELHSDIDFDYPAYTAENLGRFEQVYRQFKEFEVRR
jgi:thiamine kinase-like enzyme